VSKKRIWVILVTVNTYSTKAFQMRPFDRYVPNIIGQIWCWRSADGRDGSVVLEAWSDNLDDALFEAAKAVDMTLQDQGVKHGLVKARRLYASGFELAIFRQRTNQQFRVTILTPYGPAKIINSTGNWPEGWRVDRDARIGARS